MALKLYLNVPYADREKAKAAGARWDTHAKRWYVEEGADAQALPAHQPADRQAR